MPDFRKGWRFWWRASRLDARPVIWSLRNNPQDWTVERDDSYHRTIIRHVPSQHEFVVGSFRQSEYTRLLYSNGCSCHDATYFHTWQATPFKMAAHKYVLNQHRDKTLSNRDTQFRSHFA
jgi:hypothetical protein